jgi:hypothetical protein
VVTGDTVNIRNGNYGNVHWSGINNSDWITYQAATGHTPRFNSLYLNSFQGNPSSNTTYLRFNGLHIEPTAYGSIPESSPWIVNLFGVKYVDVNNCYIKGLGEEEWFGCGILIQVGPGGQGSSYITTKNTTVYDTENGIAINGPANHLTFTDVNSIKTGDNCVSGADINDSSFINCEFGGTFIYHYGVLLDGNDTISGTFTDGETIIQEVTGAHGTVKTPPAAFYADYNSIGDGFCMGTIYYPRNGHLAIFLGSRTGANGTPYNQCDGFDTIHTVRGQTSGATMIPTVAFNNTPHHLDLVQIYASSQPTDDNLVFRACKFHDSPGGEGLFLKQQKNVLIENNLFYGEIAVEIFSVHSGSISATIRNNTVVPVFSYAPTLNIQSNPKGGTFNVYNNIFAHGIYITNTFGKTLNFKNNIVSQAIFESPVPQPDGTNYIYGHYPTTNAELAALFTNPNANDFTLSAGSRAINFGNSSNAPATDFLGNHRDSSPDAGCYEYASTPNDLSFAPIGDKEVNESSTLIFAVDVNDHNMTTFIEDHNLPSKPNFTNN